MSNDNTIGMRITGDASDLLQALKQGAGSVDNFSTQAVSANGKAAASFDATGTSAKRLATDVADALKQSGADAGSFGAQAGDGANKAAAGYQAAGLSAKQLAFAQQGLPAQFTDIVVSLQGGQKPLTVLLQQGGQLKDMFGGIGPAFKAITSYVVGMVNPFTLAAAGVGVFGLAMVKANNSLAESNGMAVRLAATGRSADITREQFSALTKELTLLPGVSKEASKAVLGEFVKTREIGGGLFRELGMSVADFAAATGVTAPEAAKTLAKAFADPAQGAKELEAALGLMTSAQMLTMEAMEKVGDKAGAQRVLMDALKESTKGLANDAMTPLGRAFDGLGNAWDTMTGKVDKSNTLSTANNIFASMVGNVAALVRKLSELKLPPWLDKSFSGGLNGLVFDSLGGKGEQRGVTGTWPAQVNETDEQVKTVLGLTTGYRSQAGAMADVRAKADLVRKSLAALRLEGKDSSIEAQELEDRLGGVNEKLKSMAKKAASSQPKAVLLTGESELAGIRAKAEAAQDYLKSLQENGLAAKEQNAAELIASKLQKELEGGIKGVARANKEKSLAVAQAWAADLKATDATEVLLKAQRDFEKDRDKEIAGQEADILKLEEKAQAMEDQVRMYGKSQQAIEALGIARLQERADILSGFPGSEEQIALIQKEIDARQRLAVATDAKDVLDAGEKAAKKTDAEWKKTATSIENTLTDALMRAFEGGKSFAQAARDTIVNMFKTMVLRPVISAIMSPVSAGIGSALGLSGAANAATGGSSSGLLGTASNLSGLYSAATGGYASMMGAGMSAVLGTTAGNAAIATAITGSASSAAAAAAAAASAAGTATAATGTLAAVGSSIAVAVPYIAAAVAVVALWKSAFGMGNKESTASGISGTLNADGADVQQYSAWKQKGGWFRSDKSGTDYSAINGALQKTLDTSVTGITSATKAYATAIGLSADTVDGFSQAINISLQGLDAKAQEEAIAKALAGFADGMASVYGGVTQLAKEGEGASATLARLSTSLVTTNAWLSMLRQRVLQVGLAGADAASKLADTFGGLEQMGSAVQAYYDLYFTEAEKAATSTGQMTAALAAVGVVMPTTKEAFRAIADSLDLNTEAGRKAYAVLLTIAPEFSAVADQTAKLAQETATKLLDTFSGRQQLIPLLDVTLARFDALGDGLDGAAASTLNMGNATGWINTLLGQGASGLLYFGDQMQGLDQPLSGAQLAALSLTDQILALKLNASRTVTDIAGLSTALANVNTETFMATMQGVLKNLGDMFSGVLGDISNERIATREAALAIINPSVMTKDQITRGIAGSNVGMPTNTALVAAQNHLGYVDGLVAKQQAAVSSIAAQTVSSAALDSTAAALGVAKQQTASAQTFVDTMRGYNNSNFNYFMDMAYAGHDLRGTVPNPSGERNAQDSVFGLQAAQAAQQPAQAAYDAQLAQYNQAKAAHAAVLAPVQAYLTELTNLHLPWALQNAKAAQTAYIDSLQNYAIDASKATAKLGKLREETVKYYESQKALADLMATSASTLRKTVADYRYSQLTPEQQFRSLETQFNTAYSMALSTSGDTLAGYADQMSALLGPMMDKMQEAGYDPSGNQSFIGAMLARAEAVATRVDALTPVNYAADSLAMLGQIDSTLAALEAGSKSAERIISDAINAGRDATVGGLRQVVNALTGRGVTYFAAGGAFTNGIATGPTAFNMGMMGEAGSEAILPLTNVGGRLGVHAMGGGGNNNAELVAELRALRQDNANMRAELQAIASSSAKTSRNLDRVVQDGLQVHTDADTPLKTVAA